MRVDRRARGRCWAPALIALGLALHPRPARALEPGKRFDQYQHAAWMSVAHASTVYSLAATREGYLWVGTTEGLVRFDGQRMITFDAQRVPGILEKDVSALLETRDGALWLGSYGRGLARLELPPGAARARTLPVGEQAPGPQVAHLFEAPDGTVWAAGKSGVARFLPGNDRPLDASDGLPHRCTHVLAQDARGTLWAGTHAGLARWDGKVWVPEPGPIPASAMMMVDALAADPDGGLWVGTRGAGLWYRREGRWRTFGVAEGLGSNEVSAILRDGGGHLWVATRGMLEGTLAWLDGERFRPFPLLPQMCPGRIAALTEDGEGGLWIGAERCGLHRLADRPFHRITAQDGLPSDLILGFQPGRRGHSVDQVVVGTRGAGMARLRPGHPEIEPVRCAPGLPCDECWDFSASVPPSPGFWAVCRTNVVLRWDGRAMSRYQLPPGAPPAASNAVEASDGALWLAFEKNVVRFQDGNTTALPEQELFAGYRILFEGQGGTMWITADDGLARWRAGKTDIVRLPADDRPAEVANFLEDAAGTLWMATKGEGIRRTRGDRITTIGVANGLPTGWIVQLLEDGKGRMWASSSGGIFWVNKHELEEVAEGRRQRVQVSLYDANDGIYVGSNSFGHPAGFKDDRGRLWFATNSGIAVVDPSWRTRAPRLGLSELRLGGERVELRPGVTPMVRGTPSDLDLAFTALTFAAPDTVSFRYQLRTRDGRSVRDWVDLGSSRALHAAGLQPGDYQLALEARTREGDWNGQSVLRLEFGVRQTFYRTPGFVLLVALAVGLSLLGLHRMHLARTRAGLQALMAERTRIAREIHDTLAQAFVATSVQLECLEEALEGDPRPQSGKIRRHLDTAKKVVEESLDEARRAVWVLRPQAIEPGLVPALETLVNQVSGGTTVELEVEGDARVLPPLVASNLLRIAQEAVANARRHAQAHRIAVRLVFSSDAVVLSVADDGHGMASSGEHGPSQGILGMKERAAQIGGTLSIEGGVQGGAGTTLRVEVAA